MTHNIGRLLQMRGSAGGGGGGQDRQAGGRHRRARRGRRRRGGGEAPEVAPLGRAADLLQERRRRDVRREVGLAAGACRRDVVMATISDRRAVGFFSHLASVSIDSTVHGFVIAAAVVFTVCS